MSANAVDPCLESAHGAVSGFWAKPCPENRDLRVRNPDTNPVREPLREPVKEEEEDAQARDDRFEEFFGELLDALGLDTDAGLPGWWQGWPPREHVRRWITDLGLTEERIIAVARDSRSTHPNPPANEAVATVRDALALVARPESVDPGAPTVASPC